MAIVHHAVMCMHNLHVRKSDVFCVTYYSALYFSSSYPPFLPSLQPFLLHVYQSHSSCHSSPLNVLFQKQPNDGIAVLPVMSTAGYRYGEQDLLRLKEIDRSVCLSVYTLVSTYIHGPS